MNNEEVKFDPQTGEKLDSIEKKNKENTDVQDLQTIPNVNQSNEEFINNIENKEETITKEEEKASYIFMAIIFIIIFAAIFFLFPIISKYI